MKPYIRKFDEMAANPEKIKEDTRKLVADIVSRKMATEREMNLIKDRLNSGRISSEDYEPIWYADVECDEMWANKGFVWLWNQYKTPTGKPKSSMPYGAREYEVLEALKAPVRWGGNIEMDHSKGGMYWKGFRDISRFGGRPFNVPVYEIVAEGVGSFEYNLNGGKLEIIG